MRTDVYTEDPPSNRAFTPEASTVTSSKTIGAYTEAEPQYTEKMEFPDQVEAILMDQASPRKENDGKAAGNTMGECRNISAPSDTVQAKPPAVQAWMWAFSSVSE